MALDPKLKDAVNHLQSHAQGMRAVLDVADAIGDIGALEQLATEAEGRKATAQAELDDIANKAANAETDLRNYEAAIEGAKATAAQLVANAEAEAAAIVAKGKSDATTAANDVKNRLESDVREINGRIGIARTTLASVNGEIDKAGALLEETQAETDAVLKKADEARAYLKNLAGG